MGDEKHEKQYGVCFCGEYFNIARESLAESLALANDVLTDAVEHVGVSADIVQQLQRDAANLRDHAQAAEPSGVARLMIEVAEHLEIVKIA
jgi:hypothetical protein